VFDVRLHPKGPGCRLFDFTKKSLKIPKGVASRKALFVHKQRLDKTEGQIKNGQSSNTGNIGYTRHRTNTYKTKKHNTENFEDTKGGRLSTLEVLVARFMYASKNLCSPHVFGGICFADHFS
jgi:hypothetical protein